MRIFKEVMKGKSLTRILQNLALSEVEIYGQAIDLGSKSKNASYYRFLKIKKDTNLVFTDLFPTTDGVMKIDLESRFPVESGTQDFLLLNNVLEHLFGYENCILECHRILKKGGSLIGVVPFLHRVHYDPDDFFRYTESSLKRLFEKAGFSEIKIKPLGFGPFSAAADQFAEVVKLRLAAAVIYSLAISMDKILNRLFKGNNAVKAENFPLDYFFVCKK
ncbi:MAG: methyltransferase domain-containing protein [Patescibacteria group bacterium]